MGCHCEPYLSALKEVRGVKTSARKVLEWVSYLDPRDGKNEQIIIDVLLLRMRKFAGE